MSKRILIFVLIVLASFSFAICQAQGRHDSAKDSLLLLIRTGKEDTGKVNALNALATQLRLRNTDTSLTLSNQALELSKKLNDIKGIGNSEHMIGLLDRLKGNLPQALRHTFIALSMWDSLEKKSKVPLSEVERLRSKTYTNLGIIYDDQGNYPLSLEYYFKAMKIAEHDKKGREYALLIGNIGTVYLDQRDYKRALDYYLKALSLREKLGEKKLIASTIGNLGVVYGEMKDYPKALEYYLKAQRMYEELHSISDIAINFNSIGTLYNYMNDQDKALSYFEKGLSASQKLGDVEHMEISIGNIGSTYLRKKDYTKARGYIEQAVKMARDIGEKEGCRLFYDDLSFLDSATGNWKGALANKKLAVLYRDSISNEENTKKQTQTEMKYEFDKQQAADSIRNVELTTQEQLKHEQEIQQQKIYTFGGAIGFLLMLVVAGVSFRAFRQKQKANHIITEQKILVEVKQKEIVDSIHYAKRIQQSLLPTEKYIERNIKRLKS